MNKNLFTSDNILVLKDPGKSYPTVTPTGILKWRYQSSDEKMIPLTSKRKIDLKSSFLSVNVWPSTASGETTVPIQFQLNILCITGNDEHLFTRQIADWIESNAKFGSKGTKLCIRFNPICNLP